MGWTTQHWEIPDIKIEQSALRKIIFLKEKYCTTKVCSILNNEFIKWCA